MADVVFARQGNLDASTKQDSGALLRISQALSGLVDSLISSLGEFRDVGNSLDLEIAAGVVHDDESQTNVSMEVRPQLLLAVAGALKEMEGTLVSDIKANAEVQKLLPAIQKTRRGNHGDLDDLFQDLRISEQPLDDLPSYSDDISRCSEEMPICTFSEDLRIVKRAAEKGQNICKHSCEGHQELVDPGFWRKLPQELVEMILARLPLPRIIEFRNSSKVWSALPHSSNFRDACSEAHPKLFWLVGCDPEMDSPCISIHDIKSKEWLWFDMGYFPHLHVYKISVYSCDGGLACLAPVEWRELSMPCCSSRNL